MSDYCNKRLAQISAETAAADVWVGPAFQMLTLEELIRLAVVDYRAARPGVYFLFKGSRLSRHPVTLLYIGVSDDVKLRVAEHRSNRLIQFDTATFLAVPWPWHLAIEQLYIQKYETDHNRRYRLKTQPFPHQIFWAKP